MKAYIFLFLLALSSCTKNDDTITFEISVVNGNTGEAITEGSIFIQGLRDAGQLDLMGGPTVYEDEFNIEHVVNTISVKNNQKIEFFTFEYYKSDRFTPTQMLNGCELYQNQNPTCISGSSKYKIELQVFE